MGLALVLLEVSDTTGVCIMCSGMSLSNRLPRVDRCCLTQIRVYRLLITGVPTPVLDRVLDSSGAGYQLFFFCEGISRTARSILDIKMHVQLSIFVCVEGNPATTHLVCSGQFDLFSPNLEPISECKRSSKLNIMRLI
jgi:hypothetical protein